MVTYCHANNISRGCELAIIFEVEKMLVFFFEVSILRLDCFLHVLLGLTVLSFSSQGHMETA